MSKVTEAYNAALEFALETLDDNYDTILFLKLWREGCWPEIERDFPEFDLTTARPCGYKPAPKPKQIDMTPFIKNGLDCEFWNEGLNPVISCLQKIEPEEFNPYRVTRDFTWFRCCRPRLNHPFIWEGQDLPAGLVVEYGHWNQSNELIWGSVSIRFGNKVARITGCKKGYTFAGGE